MNSIIQVYRVHFLFKLSIISYNLTFKKVLKKYIYKSHIRTPNTLYLLYIYIRNTFLITFTISTL